MASTFETLLQALGAALELDLAPAADGIAEVAIGPRAVCLKPVAQETALRLFTTIQSPLTPARPSSFRWIRVWLKRPMT